MRVTEIVGDHVLQVQQPVRPALDIAITGIGLITPLGNGCNEHIERLRTGQPAVEVRPVPAVDGLTLPIAVAGEVDFRDSLRLPKNEKYMLRPVRLAMQAALEAVSSSGIRQLPGFDPDRLGIYTGSGQTGLEYNHFFNAASFAWRDDRKQDFKYLGGRASRLLDPYFSLRTLSNAAAALISAEVEARGPSVNYVHSDTASASAIQAACYDLLDGWCDAAVTGGYDCLLVPAAIHAFRDAGLLLDTDREPSGRGGNSIVPAEGACFFVLERKSSAQARGAAILGEIVDIELSIDSATAMQPIAASDHIRTVFEKASASVKEIDFVVAPGWESQARVCKAPVTSFKGLTGYLGAATAAVEVGLGLLAAQNGFIPPAAGEPPRTIASNEPVMAFIALSCVGQVSVTIAKTIRS